MIISYIVVMIPICIGESQRTHEMQQELQNNISSMTDESRKELGYIYNFRKERWVK